MPSGVCVCMHTHMHVEGSMRTGMLVHNSVSIQENEHMCILEDKCVCLYMCPDMCLCVSICKCGYNEKCVQANM